MNQPATIHAEELYQRIECGEECIIIDVRTEEEYRALHAKGALLLTLDECNADSLGELLAGKGYSKDSSLYLICHSGQRATEAARTLREAFPSATVIQGGTLAWAQAGLPVTPGTQP
ncbi:MAG TPA: rhodanese-like domain-containing protein [Gammaproteobacteria bacterium]|nr:rhodanese-like domain-containing protein [Gammaproteobacteria bacterium]